MHVFVVCSFLPNLIRYVTHLFMEVVEKTIPDCTVEYTIDVNVKSLKLKVHVLQYIAWLDGRRRDTCKVRI